MATHQVNAVAKRGVCIPLVLHDSLRKRSFSLILFVSDIQTNRGIEPSVSVRRAIQLLIKSCTGHRYAVLLAVAVLGHAGEL